MRSQFLQTRGNTHGEGVGLTVWILGGNDVFVDIGNKFYGVRACQKYLGGIEGSQTLHVGDQFLSAGANDFKVRVTTVHITIFYPIYICVAMRIDRTRSHAFN